MNESLTLIEQPQAAGIATIPRLDVAAIQQRVADIERVINTLMVKGVHYGPAFPGSDKDSLLQAGAELLLEAFGLIADPEVTEIDLPGDHKRFIVDGYVRSPNGAQLGRMRAECSTLEPKYRYRNTGLTCPECGFEGSVLKSKPRDGEKPPAGGMGWFCWKKKGGCGATFPATDKRISEQKPGRSENPDPAELYHTCTMMAQKRWMVAVTRRTLALSSRFIDEDTARLGAFDWKRARPLLRAMPGDRAAKWNRVILRCLEEFGKPPDALTNLEGEVILAWIAHEVAEGDALKASDFMESPEENGAATRPAEGKDPAEQALVDLAVGLATGREDEDEEPAGDPLPASESKILAKELQRVAGPEGFAAFCDEHGLPPAWTKKTQPLVVEAIRAAKAAP